MATVKTAYRFALAPSPAQERMLCSHAGAARFAWNWGLGAPRGALSYHPCSGWKLEEVFSDLMALPGSER